MKTDVCCPPVDMVHCGVAMHSQSLWKKKQVRNHVELVTVCKKMISSCPIQPVPIRASVRCSAGFGVGRRQECGQVGEFWK